MIVADIYELEVYDVFDRGVPNKERVPYKRQLILVWRRSVKCRGLVVYIYR
jgi:hypothetical protein